jgi:hypothetical protein
MPRNTIIVVNMVFECCSFFRDLAAIHCDTDKEYAVFWIKQSIFASDQINS